MNIYRMVVACLDNPRFVISFDERCKLRQTICEKKKKQIYYFLVAYINGIWDMSVSYDKVESSKMYLSIAIVS